MESIMNFETELRTLIEKYLPTQVTICTGKVTYRQTLETPEEYEEIEVDLDAEAFMKFYSEDIDNLIYPKNKRTKTQRLAYCRQRMDGL